MDEDEDFAERRTIAKTDETWASGITNCTNATFGRVHQFSDANSVVHKQVYIIPLYILYIDVGIF